MYVKEAKALAEEAKTDHSHEALAFAIKKKSLEDLAKAKAVDPNHPDIAEHEKNAEASNQEYANVVTGKAADEKKNTLMQAKAQADSLKIQSTLAKHDAKSKEIMNKHLGSVDAKTAVNAAAGTIIGQPNAAPMDPTGNPTDSAGNKNNFQNNVKKPGKVGPPGINKKQPM